MIKQSHQSSMCVKSPQRRSQNLGDDFGDVRKFARNLNTLWANSHITNKNGTLVAPSFFELRLNIHT